MSEATANYLIMSLNSGSQFTNRGSYESYNKIMEKAKLDLERIQTDTGLEIVDLFKAAAIRYEYVRLYTGTLLLSKSAYSRERCSIVNTFNYCVTCNELNAAFVHKRRYLGNQNYDCTVFTKEGVYAKTP